MRIIKLTQWNHPSNIYWLNVATIKGWIEYQHYTEIFVEHEYKFYVKEKAEEIFQLIARVNSI